MASSVEATSALSSQNYDCTLGYTLQVSNLSLINLFVQTYSGIQGQQQWLQIPSNQVLASQNNYAEISARWNLLYLSVQNSVTPACDTVCSTNLSNQLNIHDLLLLSLLPPSYQPTTCAIPQATASTSTAPVTVTNINQSGQASTSVIPPPTSFQSSSVIQSVLPNSSMPAVIQQQNSANLQNLINTLTLGNNGFSGTVANSNLFG
jgi:hypothetical protein